MIILGGLGVFNMIPLNLRMKVGGSPHLIFYTTSSIKDPEQHKNKEGVCLVEFNLSKVCQDSSEEYNIKHISRYHSVVYNFPVGVP